MPVPTTLRLLLTLGVAVCVGVTTAGLAPADEQETDARTSPAAGAQGEPPDPVYKLAGGCYALQSTETERFVTRAGESYRAAATEPESAEPFSMKASALGRYMFHGPNGHLMAAGGNGSVHAVSDPDPETDWTLNVSDGDYTVSATGTGENLRVEQDSGHLAVTEGEGTPFALVETRGCSAFPESDVSTEGEPFTTGPDDEVRGFIDTHGHLNVSEFIGGRIHCGTPFHPQGVSEALVDCPDHEPFGLGAWWENITAHGSPAAFHDTQGWPTFRDWPSHDTMTHHQTYYRWVERAWRGGLRIFNNLLVSNRQLCEIYPLNRNPCDEMETIRIQVEQTKKLEEYIDAQHGGPGRGWFRIVTSPEEAREVIEEGKLAVTLGIEISELFGCRVVNGEPQCTEEDIDEGLDEIDDLGVRQVVLTHKFDNALGGVRFDPGAEGVFINLANFLSTGRFWQVESCEGSATDNPIEPDNSVTNMLYGPLSALEPIGVTLPVYPEGPHCNVRGLTDLGEHAVRGLIDRNMILDVDHMSVKTADDALSILEEEDYPRVMSSHSWTDPHFFDRIYQLGGFIAPMPSESEEFVEVWRDVREARDEQYYFGFGFGADTGGFAAQPPPRDDVDERPVQYPYETFDGGTTMHQHTTGEREWDINVDGVAHYGMYPDWIEDLRIVAGADGEQLIEDLARGPEAYLRMWQR